MSDALVRIAVASFIYWREVSVLAAIDIHKRCSRLACWIRRTARPARSASRRQGKRSSRGSTAGKEAEVVAIEATTSWRWVARELEGQHLTDPGQASVLQGARKCPKNDRLDARWLVMLLAREMLLEAWLTPEEIQSLRDKTRLRKALTDDHTCWAQRLHAVLVHEGWACQRGPLLTRPIP